MAGFLSKTRQKVEHTGKINLGEFKLLGSVIGSEKTLLNSHIRAGADCKKAAAALEEWAQAEGADLTDTLGKVAKLLGNDLARAEEEYAEHLNSYRLYFKGLREREEKFSQLKKNKSSLQSKIDSAEKKLAKMNPENKDLPNLTTKLQELKSEMIGMDHAVINEDAALADHKRHTARSAVAHKLGALCQLGEKMTIIGELGKLLVFEIPVAEPGRDRGIYTSHDRTQQIYGEAQTCLHGVKFDSGANGEHATNQLPVPSSHQYDQSYDFDQEAAQQDAYAGESRQEGYSAQPDDQRLSAESARLGGVRVYEKGSAPLPSTSEEVPSRSYQPLTTPNHQEMENEFSEAVNAGWKDQQGTSYPAEQAPYARGTETIQEKEETPTVSSVPRAGNGIGGFVGGRQTETSEPQSHVPTSIREYEEEELQQTTPVIATRDYEAQQPSTTQTSQDYQSYTPSGDDLYGTGLYGNTAESPKVFEAPVQTRSEPPAEQSRSFEQPVQSRDEPPAGHFGAYQQPVQTRAEPPVINTILDRPYDTSAIVMSPVIREPSPAERSPPLPSTTAFSSQAPPPARPAGPAQSRAPSSSVSRQPLPNPGATVASPTTLTSPASPPLATKPASPKAVAPPPIQQQHSYSTLTTSKGSPATTPTIAAPPTSPTRNKPAKQSSYRSEHRQSLTKRQDSGEYGQRSSIAYLNDVPKMEPIMKAPPPVTSLGPLPSTSPYFNSYATLRSSSYGKPDAAPSTKATSTSESASRPKVSRGDSKLGSKRGYDMKAVQPPAHEKPLLQHPIANVNPGAGGAKDYTYAIHDGSTSSGGRKLNAGAFRRAPARESSFMSTQSTGDGTMSPAQRLRDEWRSSAYSTPLSTPAVDIPEEQAQPTHLQRGSQFEMYGDRANSTPTGDYSHRTSAIDAPTDVLPNDNQSHSSLQNLAEGEEEGTLPLNLRKRSMIPQEEDAQGSAPPYEKVAGQSGPPSQHSGGFDGGRYVTNLD